MPMSYAYSAVSESDIPRASAPILQHLVDTYASETNKVISVWREFSANEMPYRPHPRSSSVEEIMKHQLLSERRFFGEFLGAPEPLPAEVLPEAGASEAYAERLHRLALPRLNFFAGQSEAWWLESVRFFDVKRERIWIFWRRVLHTCHHRTQVQAWLRLAGSHVPAIYGPSGDESWADADPTNTVAAAGRPAP